MAVGQFQPVPSLGPLHPKGQRVSPSFLGATYIRIWAELDEKALPLEAQLPHFCPVEGIDLREALRRKVSASEPGNA